MSFTESQRSMKSNQIPGRYSHSNLRLNEREKRRMKQGRSSCSHSRIQDMVRSLRYRGSSAGMLDQLDASDIRYIEALRSRHALLLQYDQVDQSGPEADSDRHEAKKEGVEPSFRLALALDGLIPSVETISMKRGGAAYQVPLPISHERGISLAVRWLIQGTKERMVKEKHRSFSDALRIEALYVLRDLSRGEKTGTSGGLNEAEIKSYSRMKKLAMHRIAKSNRVFAHLRWR